MRGENSTPANSSKNTVHSVTMKQKLEAHWRLFLCAFIRAAFHFAKKYDTPKIITPTT